MSTRRMITSEIWEDDFFTSLSYFDRLIWIGLITACADDQGRLQDSSALIRSKIFPLDDIAIKEIESALNRFSQSNKIERYIANGKKVIQILGWWKHQTPRWAGKSILPPPPGWIDRERYHTSGNEIIELNWKSQGGYIDGYIAAYTTNDVKGDVNVNGEGEGEIEVEAEPKTPPPPNTFTIYEHEIGILTPMISAEIKAAEDEYPPGWITDAIAEAVQHNARNWKYIAAILKRWKADGYKRKSNGDKPKDYTSGQFSEFIQH